MSTSSILNAQKNLTILLTLKDRALFTFRWMSYAQLVKFPFKVLIADGGADERVTKVLSDRASFPNVDYEYVRYPYDASYAHFYSKVDDALARVRTPFAALADNDDFFSISGLRDATEFLLAHPEYSSCAGQHARFWVTPRTAGDTDLVYGNLVGRKCDYNVRSISEGTAKQRILRCQSPEDCTYYNVKRTDDLRREFRAVKSVNPKDIFLHELLVEFLTLIEGKTKRLDGLYLARQLNSPGSSAGLHAEAFGDWFGRMLVPTFSDDLAKVVDTSSRALASADCIPLVEAQEYIVKVYRAYLAPSLLYDVLKEPSITGMMPFVIRFVQQMLGMPRDSAIRKIAQNLYRRVPWISVDVASGERLISRRAANAHEEFEPIAGFLARGPEQ